MSKVQENDQTRANEAKVSEAFIELMRCLYPLSFYGVKQSMKDRIDFRLNVGERTLIIYECRCRRQLPDKHPTWFMDNAKVERGFRVSADEKIPFALVWSWAGHCYWGFVKRSDVLFTAWGGRYDRFLSEDIDLMAHFSPRIFNYFVTLDL